MQKIRKKSLWRVAIDRFWYYFFFTGAVGSVGLILLIILFLALDMDFRYMEPRTSESRVGKASTDPR